MPGPGRGRSVRLLRLALAAVLVTAASARASTARPAGEGGGVADATTAGATPRPIVSAGTPAQVTAVTTAAAASVAAMVDVSPLAVALEVPAGGVEAGRQVRVRAIVHNLGDAVVGPVSVELRFSPAGLDVRSEPAHVIRRIVVGRSGSVAWRVRGLVPGVYVLVARASVGPFTTDSPAAVLRILPPRR